MQIQRPREYSMTIQSLLFATYRPVLAGGITLLLALGLIAWRRRMAPGAIPLIAMFLGAGWWALCYAVPLPELDQAERFLRFRLAFPGIVLVAPAILVFSLEYTGRKNQAAWRFIALLLIKPAILLLAVSWAPLHDLLFGAWRGRPGDGYFKGGPLFWAHTLYDYMLIMIGYGLLVRHYLRESPLYRRPVQLLLIGMAIPFVFNVITVLHVIPPGIDITPIGFAICSVFVATAVFKHGLLVPIAREKIIEAISDGVLVVDTSGCIVDSNPAAHDILKGDARPLRGRHLKEVLPQWTVASGTCDGENERTEVFIAGSDKYVDLRPISLKDASGTLKGSVLVLRDITTEKNTAMALEQANQQLRAQLFAIESMQKLLREQAIKDALTGLFNRRYLEETLQRELRQAERTGDPLAIVLIDIDYFKKINDTHGHACGDAVLQALGAMLLQKSRAGDLACRYGGEEFVIILIGTSHQIALQRAEQWRAEFAALSCSCNGTEISATLSAGVAVFPDHGREEGALLKAADDALYAAKAAGRNNVKSAVAENLAA